MPAPSIIRANGWRQGKLFKIDNQPELEKLIQEKIPENTRCIVVSNDCNVVHESYEKEPDVEVLLATHVDGEIDGGLTHGKNPRFLQIPILGPKSNSHYQCHAAKCYKISRNFLESVTPDSNFTINSDSLDVLKHWLANRYIRAAFPDTFNNRIFSARDKIEKILKRHGRDITGIYVAISPFDELLSDQPYKISIYATMHVDTYKENIQRDLVIDTTTKIVQAVAQCQGIEVIDYNVYSEEEISIAALRYLRQWDLDYLSFRDIPGGDHPPRVA